MSHTKGPWTVRNKTEFRNQIAIEPCIGCAYGAGQEVLANATLMAAAPELLEALVAFVNWENCKGDGVTSSAELNDLYNTASIKARMALNVTKAKGE